MNRFLHSRGPIAGLVLLLAGAAVLPRWVGRSPNPERGPEADRPPERARAARSRDHTGPATGHGSRSRAEEPGGIAESVPEDQAADAVPQGPAAPRRVGHGGNVDRDIVRRGWAGPVSRQSGGSASQSASRNRLTSVLGDSSRSGGQRVGALADLGTLNAAERQSAYEHLASSRPADDLPRGARHWLVDELITALRVDGGDNAELTRQLANVFRNRSQDPVVRDYALQHLGHLRDEGGERGIIDGILRDATTETQGTIAGTALLALNQNKEEDAGATALAVATDATYDLRSRITAIQVAGKQGNMAALPVAVAIASDEAQPAVLRMSAIATIADLRAAEQRPLLADLSRSDDIRLRTAAAAALKTLSMETSN